MRAVITNYGQKLFDLLGLIFGWFTLVWVICALSFQLYMIFLHVSGKEETIRSITSWFTVTLDGNFKNHPSNIWYEEPKLIDVSSVTNRVVMGSLAGNRNLEFGVKNIIEEILQEKEYELDKASTLKISAEIVYLDVLKTQSSFSVLHNNKESVVIRLKGYLHKDGKVIKKALVEESAAEVSMSAVLIDEGGKFNQQNLSSALKKASVSLVNKLL